MMTKKDFQLVANVVSSIGDVDTRKEVALNFASEFQKENPRFEILRFMKTCRAFG